MIQQNNLDLEIKCITIWQPWAELIVNGNKDRECRSWPVRYTGPLLIHAGKKFDPDCLDAESFHLPRGKRQLDKSLLQGKGLEITIPESEADYQYGGIVGLVWLTDCLGWDRYQHPSDYRYSPWHVPGQYGWVLEKARRLPFTPMRGQQGLYSVTAEILDSLGLTEAERHRNHQKQLW